MSRGYTGGGRQWGCEAEAGRGEVSRGYGGGRQWSIQEGEEGRRREGKDEVDEEEGNH